MEYLDYFDSFDDEKVSQEKVDNILKKLKEIGTTNLNEIDVDTLNEFSTLEKNIIYLIDDLKTHKERLKEINKKIKQLNKDEDAEKAYHVFNTEWIPNFEKISEIEWELDKNDIKISDRKLLKL